MSMSCYLLPRGSYGGVEVPLLHYSAFSDKPITRKLNSFLDCRCPAVLWICLMGTYYIHALNLKNASIC